ncbi:MAG: hypothetical protein ACI9C3_000530, partial [Yoonia sp.]
MVAVPSVTTKPMTRNRAALIILAIA